MVSLRCGRAQAAPPLPLAGEGWGGGASASGIARVERAPTRIASIDAMRPPPQTGELKQAHGPGNSIKTIKPYAAFWQCAQVPVISTTESFGAKPEARTAAVKLCATGAAGISPTEPQRSQIRNATSDA
jgi:hypothetical protein